MKKGTRTLAGTVCTVGLAVALTIPSHQAFANEPQHAEGESTSNVSMQSPLEQANHQQLAEEQVETTATNININIDPVAIFDGISTIISNAQNRGGFVKAAREHVKFESDYRLNVMVLNLSNDYDESSYSGVHYFDTFVYDGAIYGVWAFEEGTFVNNGDGGYDNWAFYGWFDRDGGTVDFHMPPE